MTQEQRITRGSIVIFVLSIVLLLCLALTATLAYFAGSQSSNMTLILGGPVRIRMLDANDNDIGSTGTQKLYMEIKTDRTELLPGTGIDMQAIAHITSSQINSTRALLRARLDITVTHPDTTIARDVERIIRESLAECLTQRQENVQNGWVYYDGGYYYCSKNNT